MSDRVLSLLCSPLCSTAYQGLCRYHGILESRRNRRYKTAREVRLHLQRYDHHFAYDLRGDVPRLRLHAGPLPTAAARAVDKRAGGGGRRGGGTGTGTGTGCGAVSGDDDGSSGGGKEPLEPEPMPAPGDVTAHDWLRPREPGEVRRLDMQVRTK